QVAIAAGKLSPEQPPGTTSKILLEVLSASEDDGLLPRIVWQNLENHVVADQARIVEHISGSRGGLATELAPRIANRLLAKVKPDLSGTGDQETLRSVLNIADLLAADRPAAANQV